MDTALSHVCPVSIETQEAARVSGGRERAEPSVTIRVIRAPKARITSRDTYHITPYILIVGSLGLAGESDVPK